MQEHSRVDQDGLEKRLFLFSVQGRGDNEVRNKSNCVAIVTRKDSVRHNAISEERDFFHNTWRELIFFRLSLAFLMPLHYELIIKLLQQNCFTRYRKLRFFVSGFMKNRKVPQATKLVGSNCIRAFVTLLFQQKRNNKILQHGNVTDQ